VEKGLTYTNHHEKYDVDESALKRGAAVMAQFAVDYLAESAQ
jgi:metal-dependent amidase/aminoacylase/carboxypeptidase family protein